MAMDNIKKRLELMELYGERLDLYFEIKAYLYDAHMTDKYDELGEPIDFEKEIAKLDRKIAKLKPKADARKEEASRVILEDIEHAFDEIKRRVDG